MTAIRVNSLYSLVNMPDIDLWYKVVFGATSVDNTSFYAHNLQFQNS